MSLNFFKYLINNCIDIIYMLNSYISTCYEKASTINVYVAFIKFFMICKSKYFIYEEKTRIKFSRSYATLTQPWKMSNFGKLKI